MPRTAADLAAELHTVLQAGGVPGPYVLVGHSLGGVIVRLFAASHPNEVAGMVLVDALNEGLRTHLSPANWQAYDRFNSTPIQGVGYPDMETVLFNPSIDQLVHAQATTPLKPMPLIVLSKALSFELPADAAPPLTTEALDSAWELGQNDLPALVPGARQIIATESAHYIQFQQPELVVAAIREVVTALRIVGGR
jgi:pimeloyl-ACP methyl ester carboxylesterase